ncbi:deacetylase sulfotransferase [Luteitalea sp. TBR-22]|uniref:sulfotransferase domain-containing protein n=1 Tax=Luteitalea sp. TBR-22 TaxID=2802971 RepID=UPI001AF51203|nr:sulfotransferase domain-containing protein [Luteitalea sp. TBR-22]BCS33190.1 deacetylase sulfotransferase [Luteitalea sp. TBR-22]
MLPDFVIIGTQKGGTSSLYQYLAMHPDVLPAFKKEVHYFGWEYARGPRWYRAHFPLAWARDAHARRLGTPAVTGEATPYYLFHPHVPGRMHALVPEARVLVLLRDPVSRALSSYRHQVRQGRETRPLLQAMTEEHATLAGEVARLEADPLYKGEAHRHFSYVSRGFYADQLERWFAVYPREQILVLRSEDFFRETASVYARVVEFLGLRPWAPSAFTPYNVARSQALRVEPDEAATRAWLAATYAPHNVRLESMLERNLGWTAP